MIAVYTRAPSEGAESLRAELLDAGIPCALVGPEYGHTDLLTRLPFVVPAEDLHEMHDRLLASLPAGKILTWSEDVAAVCAVREAYRILTGMVPDNMHRNGIRINGSEIRFRGEVIRLTSNEKRILSLYLTCPEWYFTAEETACLCLKNADGKAAAVHICHMNAKAKAAACVPMIECRRYKGYRLPTEF